MPKVVIERGIGHNKLSADAIRTIHEGIVRVLEKLGEYEHVVKVITIQPWQTKGRSQYLKGRIVIAEPGLGNGKAVEFEDEFFLKDDTADYVFQQIVLKITHLAGMREGQHRNVADQWNEFSKKFIK